MWDTSPIFSRALSELFTLLLVVLLVMLWCLLLVQGCYGLSYKKGENKYFLCIYKRGSFASYCLLLAQSSSEVIMYVKEYYFDSSAFFCRAFLGSSPVVVYSKCKKHVLEVSVSKWTLSEATFYNLDDGWPVRSVKKLFTVNTRALRLFMSRKLAWKSEFRNDQVMDAC